LEENEAKINEELIGTQGKPQDWVITTKCKLTNETTLKYNIECHIAKILI
jgi:hypothetical protein